MRRTRSRVYLMSAAWLMIVLAGCASGNPAPGTTTGTGDRASRADSCRVGDREIGSEAACLQDDAACYQIADGGWCTGPREPACPAGSTALSGGGACPAGARCFQMSDSLQCLVGT